MYQAEIIADSVAPHGVRLTTLKVVFPRFILAEVNTHRMLSRNSASSRAIPSEKLIQRAIDEPFVPETFNARVKGMGVGEALDVDGQKVSRDAWLWARDKSVQSARVLLDAGVDKSRINRLLEPFLWHTALISATEWSNFFALRDHPDAQPEFQIVAALMREAMEASNPQELAYGEWHLPLVSRDELADVCADLDPHRQPDPTSGRWKWAHVSGGRCFRVSYDIVTDDEPVGRSIERCETAPDRGHWSPLEHPAMAVNNCDDGEPVFIGNFRGFAQLRKLYAAEADFQLVINAESAGAVG